MSVPPDDSRDSRYARQARLPQVGDDGQRRLAGASVLVAGCGALGSALAETLARAGVGSGGGRLVVVDRDVVERSNLQRQTLFDDLDAERALPKAIAAERRLREINPTVNIDAHVADLDAGNVVALAGCDDGDRKVDVIVDGLDNFETRYLLNDVAVKHAVPYVYGGAVGTTGTAMVVLPHSAPPDIPQADRDTPWEKIGLATPDLRDLFETLPPPGSTATCDTAGVLGPIIAVVAAWQATEALKILLGDWEAVNRKLLSVDLWTNRVNHLDVSTAYESSSGICSKQRRFEFLERATRGGAVKLCGRDAVQVAPAAPTAIDFAALTRRWAGVVGHVRAAPFMARAELLGEDHGLTLTVFEDGRALIQGTDDAARARTVVARYLGS
ncbi:MAG: ThiF family adenylyltransferase [Planctomycetota bacterium]